MPRIVPIIVCCALIASLVACGGGGTSAEVAATSAGASATPAPTPEATPSPEPTADAAAFGEAYEELSADLAVRTCPLGALIDEAPEDPAAWQEAMTGFGEAWDSYADDLASLIPPESVASDVDALIAAARALSAGADEIVAAPADIDAIYAIFDASYAPPRDEVGAAGDAIRAALELAPRDENPCD
jgi:hypothetical protein